MPKSKYQSEFEDLFASELERQRELVTDGVHNLLNTKVPREIAILLLETHSQWYSFPVHVFALDKKGQNETYFKKPFSGPLVAKKRKLVRDRVIDQDYFEDHDVDTFRTGHELIAKWIAEIWRDCGGRDFSVSAYIAAHDDPRYFDLKKQRWVRQLKSG